MPIIGRHGVGCIDFPANVKDSVTILPFKDGGTTTLASTNVAEDLVLVSSLRRFEQDIVARGLHTGAGNSATLIDSTQAWCAWGVEVGDLVSNTTDCSTATITAINLATDTITAVLSGGTDNDYDACDAYNITTQISHQCSRAETIRKISIITNLAVYVKFDGEATCADHDVHLFAGESFTDDTRRIISRISFVNTTGCQTPQVRWNVTGV